MHASTDIRAHIEADALLQREISHALLAIADSLTAGTDRRVVRILIRTLEASWSEHVSFQDGVVFPILTGRHGVEVQVLIDHRRAEHASLSQQHAKISHHLDSLMPAEQTIADGLEKLLRSTHMERLSHLSLDAELDGWLPENFTDAECSLCEKWLRTHASLRFPLSLLRQVGQSFPRLGKWLH